MLKITSLFSLAQWAKLSILQRMCFVVRIMIINDLRNVDLKVYESKNQKLRELINNNSAIEEWNEFDKLLELVVAVFSARNMMTNLDVHMNVAINLVKARWNMGDLDKYIAEQD